MHSELVWPPAGGSRRRYLVVAVAEPFWSVIEACMVLALVSVRCRLFATGDAPVSPHHAGQKPLRHMRCWVAEQTIVQQKASTNRFTAEYISGLEPTDLTGEDGKQPRASGPRDVSGSVLAAGGRWAPCDDA